MANLCLKSKDFEITASKAELKNFILHIAKYEKDLNEIKIWVQEKTRKL